MHLRTFRKAAAAAGLNPYLRRNGQHPRALLLGASRPRAGHGEGHRADPHVGGQGALRPRPRSRSRSRSRGGRWSIGGGVAGIQAALDIADAGYQVVLVEREPSIGGKMAGLSETFPTLDCSQCILTPRMVDVGQHPQHQAPHLLARSKRSRATSATSRSRSARRPATSTWRNAPAAAQCWNVVPLEEEPERVRLRHGQPHGDLRAVPAGRARPAGDRPRTPACNSRKGKCGLCAKKCQAGSRSASTTRTELVTEEVGAVVVATGFKLYSIGKEQDDGADSPATANTATASTPT